MDMVSIVIPAFNAEDCVAFAVNSVLCQTYENIELIIIDDCSTDNTLGVLAPFINADDRINLITLQENCGVVRARNAGIRQASGRYIAFLDADDVWFPDKLARQIKVLKEDVSYVGCSTGFVEFSKKGDVKVLRQNLGREKITRSDMLDHNFICNSSSLIDLERLGAKIYQKEIKHEDYDFWLRVLVEGDFYCVPEPFVGRMVGHRSISSNKLKSITWHFNIVIAHSENPAMVIRHALGYGYHHIKRRLMATLPSEDTSITLTGLLGGRHDQD